MINRGTSAGMAVRWSRGGGRKQLPQRWARGSGQAIGANAATPPLFVLNGAPFTPGTGGSLTGINPHDIESIRVLSTAQSAIYGVQGANGVIEVRTKIPGNKP